jgi:SAM-dependent methyltransferase
MKEWFAEWFNSPYYPILYTNRDTKEADLFVENLIQFFKPKADALFLDIGCGQGRHTNQIAQKGYNALGIDLAEDAIKYAITNKEPNADFAVQDMRSLFYINAFDYVLNCFTSFGYFEHNRDTIKAAKTFVHALKPNGVLVIDYMNSHLVRKNLIAAEKIVKQNVEFDIRRTEINNKFEKQITITDTGKNFAKTYTEKVSSYSLQDFKHIFEPLGLTLAHTFGDYNLNPFDIEKSSRLIMVFNKTNA